MANTLTDLRPKIIARAAMLLRKRLLMPRLVNGDYSVDAANKGDTINVPLPATKTASDVVPGPTPPTPSDTTPGNVQIVLNKWKKTDFHLTDKEFEEIDANGTFIPMELEAAADGLGQQVNTDLFSEFTGIYGFAGTVDTTPFGSSIDVANEVARILHEQNCPAGMRRFVVNPLAEEKAKNLAPFRDASQSADNRVIIEGEIGRKLGFDWFMDQDVPTLTNGTLSDGTGHQALVNGAPAVGDKTINIDATSLTGTVKKGEVFTVAGDTQTYVVTGDKTASGNAITGLAFEPGAKVAWADNAQLTFKGAASAKYVNNLAFHRNAFAFANRSLKLPPGSRRDRISYQDPLTGVVFGLERLDQYMQTAWQLDILYGVKLVRAELGCRLAGE